MRSHLLVYEPRLDICGLGVRTYFILLVSLLHLSYLDDLLKDLDLVLGFELIFIPVHGLPESFGLNPELPVIANNVDQKAHSSCICQLICLF